MRRAAYGLAGAAVVTALMIGGAGTMSAAPSNPVSGVAAVTDATGDGTTPPTGHMWWTGDISPLWAGGTVTIAPTQPVDEAARTEVVAAYLQAPRPVCDDGTTTVTVAATVQLVDPGPTAELAGESQLAGDRLLVTAPPGHAQHLGHVVTVSASDLEAGAVPYHLTLETVGEKSWEVSGFSATYRYGTEGCQAAVVRDDTAVTEVDTAVTIPILDNDDLPDGSDAPVPAIQPAHGGVSINPDGTATYTPEPGFIGEDRFGYTVTGADGRPVPGTVTVTVVEPLTSTLITAPVGAAALMLFAGASAIRVRRRERRPARRSRATTRHRRR